MSRGSLLGFWAVSLSGGAAMRDLLGRPTFDLVVLVLLLYALWRVTHEARRAKRSP